MPQHTPGQIMFRVAKPTVSSSIPGSTQPIRHRQGGKHQLGACCACKAKKKKCDGGYPVCGGCVSSGARCTVVDLATSRVIPRDYIDQLEKQTASLKNEVSTLNQELATLKTSTQSSRRNLEMEIGYITLGAGAESNGFMGDSSAYSIARAITSNIGYYNNMKDSYTETNTSTPPDVMEELDKIPFTRPSAGMARNYMNSYYNNVHCQYPFLDWEVMGNYFELFLSNQSTSEADFFLYMVFAVGSQVYSNYSTNSNIYTKMYYDKAMENIHPIVERTSLTTVQAYLMLSVFSQKMPDASSIWQTIGLAIRTAATLGLHRIPYKQRTCTTAIPESELNIEQLRSRVFWCAYGMERINGVILGRPFGISDVDIDVPMPLDTEEYGVSNHVIKLRRIQSNICTFVYAPTRMIDGENAMDATRVQIMLELNDWMSTFPSKLGASSIFETKNWAEISYHNSMLLLLRPVVLEVAQCSKDRKASQRSLEWFKVFTQSASAVCMNYKELHSKGKLGYTWMAMHCVFVSGLSFLYCLWIDNSYKLQVLELKRKSLIYDTVSACSSILYVFAERFKKAIVFRDTFERVSNTVLLRLERQTGKEHDIAATRASTMTSGVLDEKSIGIDQYLNFESSLIWHTEALINQHGRQPEDESINVIASSINAPTKSSGANEAEDFSPIESSFWEFLDTTGDKYLRDIFQDMEQSLSK